jgi:hypothetical protein
MKVQALIAAAAIACGSAAMAQQQDPSSTRAHREDATTARADQPDQGKAGSKVGNAMHRLGEKTRHAFHRTGDAMHRTASKDKDRSDTRAMGAAGSGDDHARQARMDDAYANWKAKHEKNR